MAHEEAEGEIVVASSSGDPAEAVRDALTHLLEALGAAGAGPGQMAALTFESAQPAAFHPSRHVIDLAYREVLGGLRPPLTLKPGARPGLIVRARLRPAPSPAIGPAETVDGWTLAELARQYSPRLQADMRETFARWSREGEAFRAGHGGLDLAYGPGRFETLDLFRPEGPGPFPLWVFIHGGYWQAVDKAQNAQFARGMLEQGFAVAVPNYGLAPQTPLEESLAQILAALHFLVTEADALGLDADRLHLAGHSAGAQLAAMALCAADAPKAASALLLSGVFDLMPLGAIPLGRLLGLDDAARAAALSPILCPPPPGVRVALAVGEGESAAFKTQSARFAAAWGAAEPVHFPGNHFTLLDGLNGGPLLDLARATADAAA